MLALQSSVQQHVLCLLFLIYHKLTVTFVHVSYTPYYRGADKSLARPTFLCILFAGENISSVASLVIYINSTNIPPIMIVNRIYEHQNILSL